MGVSESKSKRWENALNNARKNLKYKRKSSNNDHLSSLNSLQENNHYEKENSFDNQNHEIYTDEIDTQINKFKVENFKYLQESKENISSLDKSIDKVGTFLHSNLESLHDEETNEDAFIKPISNNKDIKRCNSNNSSNLEEEKTLNSYHKISNELLTVFPLNSDKKCVPFNQQLTSHTINIGDKVNNLDLNQINQPIESLESVNKSIVLVDNSDRNETSFSSSFYSFRKILSSVSSEDDTTGEFFTDALNTPLFSLEGSYHSADDDNEDVQIMSETSVNNINKNAFTITRHRKIEVPSIDNELSVLRHSSSTPLESNVLKKVACLTFDNALIENRDKGDKSKPTPSKLQFEQCEKFEGQMLMNWFLSSSPLEDHGLLKGTALQFCSHLLSAGVIKQIIDKNLEECNEFKVDRMYYWSKSESQLTSSSSSSLFSPGKIVFPSWPPPNETESNNNTLSTPNSTSSICIQSEEKIKLEKEIVRLKNEIEELKNLYETQQKQNKSEPSKNINERPNHLELSPKNKKDIKTISKIPSPKYSIKTSSPNKNEDKKNSSPIKNISPIKLKSSSSNKVPTKSSPLKSLNRSTDSLITHLDKKEQSCQTSPVRFLDLECSLSSQNSEDTKRTSQSSGQNDIISLSKVPSSSSPCSPNCIKMSPAKTCLASPICDSGNSSYSDLPKVSPCKTFINDPIPSESSQTASNGPIPPPPPPMPCFSEDLSTNEAPCPIPESKPNIPRPPPCPLENNSFPSPLPTALESSSIPPPPPPMIPDVTPLQHVPSFVPPPPPPMNIDPSPMIPGAPPPPPPPMALGIPPAPPPPMTSGAPPPPPIVPNGPPPPPPLVGLTTSVTPTMAPPPPIPPTPSGPTPLPTPPVGGWSSNKASFRKDPVVPPKPMKPLYWTRLIVVPVESSDTTPLWKELEEIPIKNIDEFTELFSRQVVAQRTVTRKRELKPSKTQNVARLIDSKRSQNVGILAQSLHIEFSEIENSIFNMDTSVVSLEALQQIYDARATDEELALIKAHIASGTDQPLDKPEQFLYDLSEIPHFSERIACFMFEADFSDSINLIDAKLNNIKSVCQFLMKSEKLKKVMSIILSLGNFMNGGNRLRGQADGFGLEILPKLRDVKSKDNSLTLLHFIVRTYLRDLEDPISENLPVPEPGDIDRASTVVFDDIHVQLTGLAKKLDVCSANMEKVVRESKQEHLEPFQSKMETCIRTAKSALAEQLENLEDCIKRFKSVLIFYQYIPKGIPENEITPKDLFILWAPFCHDFKDFWKKEQQRILKEKCKEVKKKQEERIQQRQKIKKQESGLKARFQRLERLHQDDS